MRCFQTLATETCLFSQAQLFSFGTPKKSAPTGWMLVKRKVQLLSKLQEFIIDSWKIVQICRKDRKNKYIKWVFIQIQASFFLDLRKRITDTSSDGQNQTVKLSWPGRGSSPWPFGWHRCISKPLSYRDPKPQPPQSISLQCPCRKPFRCLALRLQWSKDADGRSRQILASYFFPTRSCSGTGFHWPSMNG